MPRPNRKKSEKIINENNKADEGLELISIGNLYTGPWDKKYWSSSRGKDRYPFPVGYRALRSYNESTYRIEISEGPAGPLFTIVSEAGQTFSGQTPDMVWESCQRKSCPRLKIWHGKRFAPKIDGVEFFGFKNHFVQRFLRELVANINGINERCSSPSSSCSGLLGPKPERECPEQGSYPDLLAYLTGPSIRGKRSRRNESKRPNSVRGASFKKCRTQDLYEEGSPPNFGCLSGHLKERAGSAKKVCNHVGSTNSTSGKVPNLCAEENLLDRSPDTTETEFNFHVAIEDQSRSALSPKDSAGVNDGNLCAPDTLDVTPYADCADFDPSVLNEDTHKRRLIAVNKVISQGFIVEAHLQEDQNTCSSNASSQKSDFDSVGQDMARSMMTLLLPQAVPLLKKAPREKEANTSSLETYFDMEAQKKKAKSSNFLDVETPASGPTKDMAIQIEELTHIKGEDADSVIPSSDYSKCLVPDSFDDNQYDDRPHFPSMPCSGVAEAVCTNSDEGSFPYETGNGLARANESSIFNSKTSADNNDVKPGPGELENSAQLSEKEGSAELDVAETGRPSTQVESVVYSRRKSRKTTNFNGPTSDKIIMRNKGNDCILKTSPPTGTVTADIEKQTKTDLFPEGRVEKQCFDLHKEVMAMSSCHISTTKTSFISEDQASICASEDKGQQNGLDLSVPLIRSAQGCISCNIEADTLFNTCNSSTNQLNIESKPYSEEEVQVCIDMESHQDMELQNELGGPFQLLGCYIHPMPVISLSLITKGEEINVSVLCGTLEDNNRTLFVYKVATDERRTGRPAFVGHTSLILPSLRDNEGRKVATERSGLQFTPDGQFLVLLDSIQVPHCREQNINCLCSTCESSSFTENAVKVVKVKFGYISVVMKMKANDCLHCILVCGPNYTVAVGESGRLHIWVMNSTWSAQTEEFILPDYDCNSPGIVEVMKIPKSMLLILGYNGFGEFSVWNISSRICLSKFSAAKTSICQFSPVGLFNWNSIDPPSGCDLEAHINGVLPPIIQQSNNYDSHSFEGNNIAIWILVSTTPNSDAQHKLTPNSSNTNNPTRLWRLALLVKDTVIMGSALDPRAASVGISSGHGVIGTCDGLAYIWEISTGARLGSLHHFKGSSVSCIAADESRSDFLAVASDGGHLLVYKHS